MDPGMFRKLGHQDSGEKGKRGTEDNYFCLSSLYLNSLLSTDHEPGTFCRLWVAIT